MAAIRAPSNPATNFASVWWRTGALSAVVVLTIWTYAPALRAYFAQDDFTLLALSRLLHQPWRVFFSDHFPGSLFFRPLGVFVWWLSTAAFDNAPYPHYVVNLAWHLGVVAALYIFLQSLRPRRYFNAVWAAVYAVHPLAIGTALWLSDRFDLIATLFALLALKNAVDFSRNGRAAGLMRLLACLLLALMGKEIAVVGAAAAFVIIALAPRTPVLTLRRRITASASIAVLTLAWLAYRHALMTNPENVILGSVPLLELFWKGSLLWLRVGFEFLALDPRQSMWGAWLLGIASVLLILAIIAGLRQNGLRVQSFGLLAAMLALVFLPGPTQAPVVYFSASDLSASTFWFNLVGESRLYYLSLAGIIATLVLITAPRTPAHADHRVDFAVAGALVLLLLAYAPASHWQAHEFAKRTREQIAPLQAANDAIAKLQLPAHRCQIYLLDAQSIWGLYDIGDPTIKASSDNLPRLDHCLIATERTPWGNFVRTGSITAADYAPQRTLMFQGRPIPWLVLGDFEAAYLNLDADIDARGIDGAFFLELRNGVFVDVTDAVRSGARPVHFFNARPQEK